MTTLSSTLTSAELLLTTALDLAAVGLTPFSAENLIVRAWEENPAQFGMKGYMQHPDTHRSYAYLCGKKGLVGRGYLSRDEGRYSLTEAGRAEAVRLSGEPVCLSKPCFVNGVYHNEYGEAAHEKPEVRDKPTRLPEYQDTLLRRLFGAKGRGQPMADWTFKDALGWWDVRCDGTPGERIARTLAEITVELANEWRAVLSNGREVSGEEVAELVAIDAALRKRFAVHLKVLARRNGEV